MITEPTNQAYKDAILFLKVLPTGSLLPSIGFADDGEVNFSWKQNGIHIDLGFYGDGTYSYFAKDSEGNKYYGDDVPVTLRFDLFIVVR